MNRRASLAACAGLVALSLLTHGRFAARFFPCVGWDQDWPVGPDDFLHVFGACGFPLDAQHLLHAFSPSDHFHHFYYCPLLHLLYLLEGAAFQFHAFGYHLVSAALHGLVAAALFALGNRVARAPLVWWTICVLFVLNPASDQTIFWLASQHVELAAGFVLLTLACFMRWREQPSPLRAAATIACFALALASKPDAFILLALLPLANWLLVERERRVARREWPALLTAVLIMVVFAVLNHLAYRDQARFGSTGVSFQDDLGVKLAAWAYLQFVAATQFEPLRAAVVTGQISVEAVARVVLMTSFLIGMACWLWRNRERTLLFALLFAVLAALMPSLPVGAYAVRMSRFWYLSIVAQMLLCGFVLVRLQAQRVGLIGWTLGTTLVGLVVTRHLPRVLTPMIPLEGLVLGPLWMLAVAITRPDGMQPTLARIVTTMPGALGTVLFVRGFAQAGGALLEVPAVVSALCIPLLIGVIALTVGRSPIHDQLQLAGALLLLDWYAVALPRAPDELPLDLTLPLLLGFCSWFVAERRQLPRTRSVLAGAAAALAAAFFLAKSNRLGARWVALGEEGKQHVEEVFERFELPRERLRFVPGWKD